MLAGLEPSASGPLAAIAARPEWQAWEREFDSQWTKATADRFGHMARWRDTEVTPLVGSCGTLMYPFSGPDILNAILLFPDCRQYVLFGLEPVGALPDIDRLPADRLERLLEETRHALNDLLARNYFITSHMMQDTAAEELRGTLPLMALALVRMDARLLSAKEMEVAADGQLVPRTPSSKDRKAAPAVEIVFERPGHEPQRVVYFRAQAQDAAVSQRPGVLPYLEHQGPFVTFLKSASYLLHTNDFTVMRRVLLQNSRLVLEDDSGIPLRYFKAPEWKVTFYGKYDKPIKDFNYGFQADMARAYSDPEAIRPLPFSFGYHWKDGSSSVLIAVRTSTSPVH
jgi:hypothetical protein